jgi:hypothetical protein
MPCNKCRFCSNETRLTSLRMQNTEHHFSVIYCCLVCMCVSASVHGGTDINIKRATEAFRENMNP